MCFHVSITSSAQQLQKRFNATFINNKVRSQFEEPQYHLNGFSHPDLPIVAQEKPDYILPAVWGIVPGYENPEKLNVYFKKASRFGGGLNAKSEKLSSHFIYKHLYKEQRCLILLDAFFEPHHFKGKSFPYLIRRKDTNPFALAGIYTRFNNGLVTCSILTRKATPLLANIHNLKKRQPVILKQELEHKWLDVNLEDADIQSLINTNYIDQDLEAYPIDKKLFKRDQDSNQRDILKPVHYPELNTLF